MKPKPKTEALLKDAKESAAKYDSCPLDQVEYNLMAIGHEELLFIAAENLEVVLEPDHPFDEGMSQDCILDMIEARLRVRLKSMLEAKG